MEHSATVCVPVQMEVCVTLLMEPADVDWAGPAHTVRKVNK